MAAPRPSRYPFAAMTDVPKGDVHELLEPSDDFARRHLGPDQHDVTVMLAEIGAGSLDELIEQTIPAEIRSREPLRLSGLPTPLGESAALERLRAHASRNRVLRSCIGMGYSDTLVPPVIQRNVLENPGWYTQYTPYQAEISQGRLEALLNFQTMVADLTALPLANASLLDEATAAAEAMHMCHDLRPDRNIFFVSAECHPQTIDVAKTRAKPLGIQVEVGDHQSFPLNENVFGALVQYPGTYGDVHNYETFVTQAHAAGALVAVAADLLSLTLLRPPGEFGADIAIGSAQRFGVPLGYGGPHAAYFATRDEYKRHMPGRIVGVSKDSRGRPALRLSLQTREQHIRREKATSNVCTAQALLANMAALYAVYHGPDGLRKIAARIRLLTGILARGLEQLGYRIPTGAFFDTIRVELGKKSAAEIIKSAEARRINFRAIDARTVGISLDETTMEKDLIDLFHLFNGGNPPAFTIAELALQVEAAFTAPLARSSNFLTHPVFKRYHSETGMLRYLRRLESRDLSLTTSMIPLGSCTMRLNATVEMFPVSWPEFSRLHPFVPLRQAQGYQILFQQLEDWLAEITGFTGISLQPNAGSQGEYAGLLVIHEYHRDRGEAR